MTLVTTNPRPATASVLLIMAAVISAGIYTLIDLIYIFAAGMTQPTASDDYARLLSILAVVLMLYLPANFFALIYGIMRRSRKVLLGCIFFPFAAITIILFVKIVLGIIGVYR